jgi:hypothetical protein
MHIFYVKLLIIIGALVSIRLESSQDVIDQGNGRVIGLIGKTSRTSWNARLGFQSI